MQVRQILKDTGLNPRQLKLEITESVVMANIDVACRILDQLRALGIQVSIDDFGTGYSSLSYLRRLSIDTLKIDRSFVAHMTDDQDSAEIVRAIINLAKSLRMRVIAEGVETEGQLQRLRQLDCDNGQGYFFFEPMTAEEAEWLVSQSKEWRAFNVSRDIACSDDEFTLAADYTM
jgi:EAL domain-containing protein (putative c-di-GMP-specific phosphodiesterase class I)